MQTSFVVGPVPGVVTGYPFIDLVNSLVKDHTGSHQPVDRIPMAGWRRWFMGRYGLLVNERRQPAPVRTLQRFREQLRFVLESWHSNGRLTPADARRLEQWLSKSVSRPALVQEAGRTSLQRVPEHRDWDWFMGAVAESAASLMSSGEPLRLKVCSNPDCRFMFYDTTRNHSRRWCSGGYCGNLHRVREFRRSAVPDRA